MSEIVAIDFGTTNSVLAVADAAGNIRSAQFEVGKKSFDTYRTILYFWEEQDITVPGAPSQFKSCSGPFAIEEYLKESHDCRLIQSIKSYLGVKDFEGTNIFGNNYSIEDLIGTFLTQIHQNAQYSLGWLGNRVISGRPVSFAGNNPDNELAEIRLKAAYEQAGFEVDALVFEPLAASYYYGRELDRPEIVLVADFGGGTSDFSVIRFTPGRGIRGVEALAHTGLGIAGDRFDYRIIQEAVWPRLGFGSEYRSMGATLPIPRQYYTAFSRWHDLSMMNQPKVINEIRSLVRTAKQPDDIEDLVGIIEEELGFHLYQAVSKAKADLSSHDKTVLQFRHHGIEIEETVTREQFEKAIEPDILEMENAAKNCLAQAGIAASEVSRVFLTGGTSYVPKVRNLFEKHFGAERIVIGQPFLSVAHGLALIAADEGII